MSKAQKNIEAVLRRGAEILRSKMGADDYKDYLIAFLFYKSLTDAFLAKAHVILAGKKHDTMEQAQREYERAYWAEGGEDRMWGIIEAFRYFPEPGLTFFSLARRAEHGAPVRDQLKKAFDDAESSDPLFDGLFQGADLYSNKLGPGSGEQEETVSELIKAVSHADLLGADEDALGSAYDYMIGKFASDAGKRAGEFYTPAGPAEILARIAISGQEGRQGLSIYDPCMGSGSLLLCARRFSSSPGRIQYCGQELNASAYNLARMNIGLRGIDPGNARLRNGDALGEDWPGPEGAEFDMVLMNPPYSANWDADKERLSDPRFSACGVLAPKSRADYAFLLHGLCHLKPAGTMAIILPRGALSRGSHEGIIRRRLVEDGRVYAVIDLPANLFYNTPLPTSVIVLKKQREGRDVLFIDASELFEKGRKRNVMNATHRDRVVALYERREAAEGEAALAGYDEIEANGFSLSVRGYVGSLREAGQDIHLGALAAEARGLAAEARRAEEGLRKSFEELGLECPF